MEGATPLYEVVRLNSGEGFVEMLVAKGADIRARDNLGREALHRSAEAGCDEVVQDLLDAGTDVNAPDGSGCTPLHYAAARGGHPTVAVLLSKGADIKAKDDLGRLPIHHAVMHLGVCVERFIGEKRDVE